MLIKHMGDGLSIESFAAIVGRSKDTIYEWVKKHPDFADAKKKGEALSLLFWEKAGITGMFGKIKGFNVAAWIFNMKNRHGYKNDPAPDTPPQTDGTMMDAISVLEQEARGRAAAPAVPAEPKEGNDT